MSRPAVDHCSVPSTQCSVLGTQYSVLSTRYSVLSTHCFPRRGFTLVELLITITIIGILAGIALGALNAARQTARESKTKATIAKINHVIMERHESYLTRRVPINTNDQTFVNLSPKERARARVNAIRDLMRMEMPDRWTDVVVNPNPGGPPLPGPEWTPLFHGGKYPNGSPATPPTPFKLSPPTLSVAYWRKYASAWNRVQQEPDPAQKAKKMKDLLDWDSAECLYMIVMSTPEAAEQFHSSEIGDIDNDGLPEFHDAWGQPIRFLRWPVGFIPAYNADTDLQNGDSAASPDPFDPRGVLAAKGSFAVFPLVYSAGADKRYDINVGRKKVSSSDVQFVYGLELDADKVHWDLNPFSRDNYDVAIGQPMDTDTFSVAPSTLDHLDNIHNHRIEQR